MSGYRAFFCIICGTAMLTGFLVAMNLAIVTLSVAVQAETRVQGQ